MNRLDKLKQIAKERLPREIIQQRSIEGKVLDYVSGQTVLDLLAAAFGQTFSIQYPEHWIEKFDEIEVYNKQNRQKEMYKPAYVITVKAVITVPVYDPETKQNIMITREGFGTATMKRKFEEMALKTASTDAMKKAAYSLGIAAELFREPSEQQWYEQLMSPWNSKNTLLYEKEWGIIRKFITDNKLTKDHVSSMVYSMTNGKDTELTPENIQAFVSRIQQTSKAA